MIHSPRLGPADVASLHSDIAAWFAAHARDLPWRGATSPWAVMVSEFMLQQTPVSRVLPVFEEWMRRWPQPSDLAASSPGDAVRAWGRLGYPRRALRLHAAATTIVNDHDGDVPATYEQLIALPGVGDYTAAAIVSFAFEGTHAVLDTNVRRVFARLVMGEQFPARSVSAAERDLAHRLLPEEGAARWAAATMELGALVCTAKSPDCAACPVADRCQWRALSYPQHEGVRTGQSWDGTDRQCRGRLMAVLRGSTEPVSKATLNAAWIDDLQRERCLDSLVKDGLVDPIGADQYALPS